MDKSVCLLAVEDLLGEAVGQKVLQHLGMRSSMTIGMHGFGYLKKRASNLNQTANGFPVFLLTDLDSPNRCPPQLIDEWIHAPRSEAFLFRVAVMEIESWIMADRNSFARYLGVGLRQIPTNTDSIMNPKEFVINLARRKTRAGLRRELVPSSGSTAKIGPEYNARLAEFVSETWEVKQAAQVSPSLQRTLSALSMFRDG